MLKKSKSKTPSAPAVDRAAAGSVHVHDLIDTLPKYKIRIANCLHNEFSTGDMIDLNAVREAIASGRILAVRNFGAKCGAVLADWLGVPHPKINDPHCPTCGRRLLAQNDQAESQP